MGALFIACFVLTLGLFWVGFYHIYLWLIESREEDENE